MKKAAALILLVTLVSLALISTGCSGGNSEPENNGTTGVEEMTIKFAYPVAEQDFGGQGAVKFKEVAEELSGGKINVQLYPAGQLGSMREHIEGTQVGSIDLAYVISSAYEPFIPEIAAFCLPFLFPNDFDQLWKVVDGKPSEKLQSYFAEKGLVLLGISSYGFNQITSNKPITCLDDFKGLNMRVVPSPILIEQYETWGTNVSAIEFGELYMALQQGTVDGQENGLSIIKNQAYHEVQKYLLISDHNPSFGFFVANKKMIDNLTDEQREIIMEAAKANIEFQRSLIVSERPKLIQFMEDNGLEVHYLSEEARQELQEVSKSVHESFIQKSDNNKEIYNIIQEEIKLYQ